MTPNKEDYEFDVDVFFDLNIGISFLSLFFPTYKMVNKFTEFSYKDINENIVRIKSKLKENEFKLAWQVLNEQLN